MTPRATDRPRLLALPCLFGLLAAACAGQAKLAPPSIDAIAQAVRQSPERASARELSMAGFAAYLIDGKPDAALELWNESLAQGEDLVALYGRFELARRALDGRAQSMFALRMCRQAPAHPLCAVGLRTVGQLIDASPQLGAEVEAQAQGLLQAGGATGEAALLLREISADLRFRRGDIAAGRALLRDAGVVDRAGLSGPWSTYAHLDWETRFPPEAGALAGRGALGEVALRAVDEPSGMLSIPGDPAAGHVYYWIADLTVAEPGRYAVLVKGTSARVFLDGTPILDRRAFAGYAPGTSGVEVELGAGVHRLLVKAPRLTESRELRISLSRPDGLPSRLAIDVPAEGEAPVIQHEARALSGFWNTADALQQALEPELGQLLSRFVAARASLASVDALGARAMAESLCEGSRSPALVTLRGEARLGDISLTKSVAQGLALHDFETALKSDAFEASALAALARHAQRERRFDRMADLLAQLRRAAAPGSLQLPELDIALAQARGVDALIAQSAERALRVDPAHCAALRALFDLARKEDAPARAAHLLEQMAGCQSAPLLAVNFLRRRGLLDEAARALDGLAALHPHELGLASLQIEIDVERQDLERARARAQALCDRWPQRASSQKKLADVLDRLGDAEGARAARARALELDGSELQLRQALAITAGTPILEGALEDGRAWIERYLKAKPIEDAPAVLVLDSFVAQIHADGALTGLTQTISRAIDQEGVSRLAEVQIPAGAEILVLRTIKEDGRILEPEPIPGKESTSMPGVEVGDFVELAYLTGEPAPAAIAPGFLTPRFYFRAPDDRFFHSTFEVRAPADMALIVDAHQIAPEEIARTADGGQQRLKVFREDVPPLAREPNGPPLDELLPWIQIGFQVDDARLLSGWADRLLLFAWQTPAIRALADEVAGDKSGRAAVQALYWEVMRRIKGDENPWRSASATLAEERGSRTNLLKALLEARGFAVRHVAVQGQPLSALETALPMPERWNNLLLAVSLPEGELLLDPATRWAPFGRLPPPLSGARAAKLPIPGEQIAFFDLPQDLPPQPHRLSLALALDDAGTLRGQGEEVFEGYQAAALRPALEKMGPERIRQMVEQSMVAANFDGARLVRFDLQLDEAGEGPVVFRYALEAPHFAQRDGEALVLPNGLFTQKLARAWLDLFSRETPLFLATPSASAISATLTLPEGFIWERRPEETRLETPFGSYARTESVGADGGRTSIGLEEALLIGMQRIEPEAYAPFGEFLTSIDRIQAKPWRLVKVPQATP